MLVAEGDVCSVRLKEINAVLSDELNYYQGILDNPSPTALHIVCKDKTFPVNDFLKYSYFFIDQNYILNILFCFAKLKTETT